MQWVTAVVTDDGAASAAAQVDAQITAGLSGAEPDLVFVFASPAWKVGLPALLTELRRRLPHAHFVGSTGSGLVANDQELEQTEAVVVLAGKLPDVGVVPFSVTPDILRQRTASQWRTHLDLIPEQQPVFVLFVDPFSTDAQRLADALDDAFPGCVKVGGLASGGTVPGSTRLISDTRIFRDGAVGVALWGDVRVVPVVAQGARGVGPLLEVTDAEGPAIRALDGRPVTTVLEDIFGELTQPDRKLFQRGGAVGLLPAADADHTLRAGDLLVRNIVGLNRARGELVVGAQVHPGDRLQLMVRDAASADAELRELLERLTRAPSPPAAGLLFNCMGRGSRFFGSPHHDAGLASAALGSPPLAGFFCNGELGPVRGRTWLHGYTASFAWFQPRGWS